ncbi:MAG: hypothetical protein WBR18_13085 [Anaerolineales bacterium]
MKRSWTASLTLGLVALGLVGCQIGMTRNPDGSLRVEASIGEEALAREVRAAIADPLVEDVQVAMQDGYASLSLSRRRPAGNGTDTLSFRLDLGAAAGHLTASLTDVVVNGLQPTHSLLGTWNERIANNLERAAGQTPNSKLQSVQVTTDGIQLVWRIETARSR